MREFIITAIIALAAAKAKAETEGSLSASKNRTKSDDKGKVANKRAGHETKQLPLLKSI